jgi:UDP-GlcNAc:undecaprenyl-phosphate/decaprenyl-phosphate GlcNAc-1-phosphate transferase
VTLLAFCAGVPLTWLVLNLGRRLRLLDLPTEIKPHARPIPYTGGMGLMIVVAATSAAYGLGAIAIAAVIVWFIGLVDDVYSLRPSAKLALEVLPTLVGVSALSMSVPLAAVAIVAGVLLINVFNVIDGLDGLAGGCALAPLLVLMMTGGSTAILAAATAGGVMAFLVFNRPPAKIFLGDEGSLLLGYLLWQIPLIVGLQPTAPRAALLWTLLWLFPLVNAAFVVFLRLWTRRPIMRGDRSHLYDFWFRRLGLARTLLLCWGIAALGAIGAVAVGTQ